MTFSTIILKQNEAIARITLNRPKILNAINDLMLDEIRVALDEISANQDARVVVVDSASDRAFSAGIDVAYVKDMDAWGARGIGQALHKTFSALRTFEKPIIVQIDGLCLGAGLELAISCDLLIASARSQFGLPNIKRGIPAIVEAAILPQAIGIMNTRELAFTGRNWDAAKAERRGLINAVVPAGELATEVNRWAEEIAVFSPYALAAQKDIIHKWMTADLETAIDFSINTVGLNWVTRDQKEGMASFLEKREAEFGEE
ncbi:MAG: enoyl-CoA hydratase/isomerase family protein [Chloroflexi bacterium]|nr:enoyl-CoA hydratase/isomerase family protein [Chloroflexota bacterium]